MRKASPICHSAPKPSGLPAITPRQCWGTRQVHLLTTPAAAPHPAVPAAPVQGHPSQCQPERGHRGNMPQGHVPCL